MKELLKPMWNSLKTVLFIPQISKEDLLLGLYYPILAFKLWCLNLAFPLLGIGILFVFSFLLAKWDLLTVVGDGLTSYFYSGYLLSFPAWKCHIVLYFCCLLMSFNAD